jgi:hypothetical protein
VAVMEVTSRGRHKSAACKMRIGILSVLAKDKDHDSRCSGEK